MVNERLQRTLRYSGKAYVHRNGTVQKARRMRAACDPLQCRFKCAARVSGDLRQRHFDAFYALANLHLQWQYVARHCDRTVPKQNAKRTVTKRRQNNIRYFLYKRLNGRDDDDERVYVCKTMFLATFDIGETTVATAMQKTDVAGNLIGVDRRGLRHDRLA